jgi:nicotinamide riboside kinase
MAEEKNKPIKITLVGPESTGKSTLCIALSQHYQSTYVAEYARTYLNEIKRAYTKQDIILIHKKQIDLEHETEKKTSGILFCDTSPIVTKVWLQEKYKCLDEEIEIDFKNQQYDLFLLCAPDIHWEADPLRENENDRQRLFSIYEVLLLQNLKPFEIINGMGEHRLLNAITAIEKKFPSIKY